MASETEKTWDKIKEILENSQLPPPKPDSKSEKEKKWYKPIDYPLLWTAVIASSLLIIFGAILIRKLRKKTGGENLINHLGISQRNRNFLFFS